MTVTLTGPDPQRLALATVEALCPAEPLVAFQVCGEARPVSANWLREALSEDNRDFIASWDPEFEDPTFLWLRGSCNITRASLFDDLVALAERVAAQPDALTEMNGLAPHQDVVVPWLREIAEGSEPARP